MVPRLAVLSCLYCLVGAFNLDYVALDPAPKPTFLFNATQEVIEQFMAIYHTNIDVRELDILVGTLRPEVQEAYQLFKSEGFVTKLSEEERNADMIEKAHYTIAHLNALRETNSIGFNERKKRIEMVFAEFSRYMVTLASDTAARQMNNVMKQMLRALLFTERLTL